MVIRVKLITVKVPDLYVKGIDELVKVQRYSSRSEVIRIAIRELLKRELWNEVPGGEGFVIRATQGVGLEEGL